MFNAATGALNETALASANDNAKIFFINAPENAHCICVGSVGA